MAKENETIIETPEDDGIEMVMNTNLELAKEQEEKKPTNSKENRYLKPDSPNGYITDKEEIEQYKYKQQIDIMKNRLLGDYNENGEYILSNEIIYELRNIKKEVIEQYKTYLFLHSVYPIQGFGKISFFVSVSKLADGKLKARLVLLEKIDRVNGMITDTISAVIDEYVAEPSATYYNNMKEKFKIIVVDQKDIDAENEDDLKYCRMRKMKMVHLWEQISADIEKREKETFEKKIRILEELKDKNPYAKAILEQLKKEREKAKIFIEGKSDKYTSLNTILDNIVNTFDVKQASNELKNVKTLIEEATKGANIKIPTKNAEKTNNKTQEKTNNKDSTSKGTIKDKDIADAWAIGRDTGVDVEREIAKVAEINKPAVEKGDTEAIKSEQQAHENAMLGENNPVGAKEDKSAEVEEPVINISIDQNEQKPAEQPKEHERERKPNINIEELTL